MKGSVSNRCATIHSNDCSFAARPQRLSTLPVPSRPAAILPPPCRLHTHFSTQPAPPFVARLLQPSVHSFPFSFRLAFIPFPSSVSSIIGQKRKPSCIYYSSRGKKKQDINLTVYPLGSRNRYILIRTRGREGKSIVSSIGIFVSLVVVVVNEARITILVTSQFVIPWMKFDFVLFSIRYPTPTYFILFNSRIRGYRAARVHAGCARHFLSTNGGTIRSCTLCLPINRPLSLPPLLSFLPLFPHSRGYELRAHARTHGIAAARASATFTAPFGRLALLLHPFFEKSFPAPTPPIFQSIIRPYNRNNRPIIANNNRSSFSNRSVQFSPNGNNNNNNNNNTLSDTACFARSAGN